MGKSNSRTTSNSSTVNNDYNNNSKGVKFQGFSGDDSRNIVQYIC